jgi:hypothetical protein
MRISIRQAADSAATARDSWQVIDSLAGLELGGAVNVARHRETAPAGAAILDQFAAGNTQQAAPAADDGLAQASENWLAVTATNERHALPQLASVGTASVVSQYIGETEKNLSTVFGPARGVSAVLLLDDADALFGQRENSKDSDD